MLKNYFLSGATSFNSPLNSFDVSKVKSMVGAFRNTAFNQDISGWLVLRSYYVCVHVDVDDGSTNITIITTVGKKTGTHLLWLHWYVSITG